MRIGHAQYKETMKRTLVNTGATEHTYAEVNKQGVDFFSQRDQKQSTI